MSLDPMGVHVYRLPPAFVTDHISRDLLPADTVVRETRRYVDVALTDTQLVELVEDARHYADPTNGWDPSLRGLCASARATVRLLEGMAES
jgi:hypothetical protein